MPTFDESWSGRLRVIGDLERPDHWYLTPEDQCAFFVDYTARAGYGASTTNQLILNLKKKPELAETPQHGWKHRAIAESQRSSNGQRVQPPPAGRQPQPG